MFNNFKKIIFLIKSQASFIIIFIFIINKFQNIFVKKQIKRQKKNNIEYLKKKRITHDYFSQNAYNFFKIIKKFNYFNYLEIGAFEGNSAMFIARNFQKSKIYCVDNWVGTEEYNNLIFSEVENNFDFNTNEFENLKKIKDLSDNFFEKNKLKFDVIYIDGYHKAFQVIKDFKNSWEILNKNGVLIFDDYIWQFYSNITDNPCYIINSYLKEIKNKYKIIKVSSSQLFIQKL